MELSEALKEHFGYDTFRKGQEAIVRSVLSGRPTIAILPTGGGKSLCYQLPALLLDGTTVVVSPLVALMKDQVDALRARNIAATFVNSSLPESERLERQSALRRGEYRLVYVAAGRPGDRLRRLAQERGEGGRLVARLRGRCARISRGNAGRGTQLRAGAFRPR